MALRFGEQDGGFGSGLIFGDQSEFTSDADITGTGAMQAQSASIAATVVRGIQDTGTPPELFAGVAGASGSGPVIQLGTGAAQAQDAIAAGVGTVSTANAGTGVLQAQDASAAGLGQLGIGGSGVLQAQDAIVAGVGGLAGQIFGAGVLVAQEITISGTGERSIKGAGTLISSDASAFGLGTVILIAVDYVCYLQPNPVMLEALSINTSYSLQFNNPRNVPRSVSVKWDDLVTYYAGPKPRTEVAYRFSNDKEFVEDQDDYPHGDD